MTKSQALAAVVEAARNSCKIWFSRSPGINLRLEDLRDALAALDAAPDEDARDMARRIIEAAEEDERCGSSGWWNRHEDAIAEALTAFAARSAK